ncbi:MAG: hypothetical protein HY828_06960 [Actinobacteria bacterium]|nr:hypothetical protein [Actinomycetota bacterium]
MRIAKVLLGVAMVGLVACGDDSSGGASAAEQPYVDSMMSSFETDESMPLTKPQAQCMAENLVSIVGVDGFEAAGVEPADLANGDLTLEELPEAKAQAIAALVFDGKCFDFGEMMASAFSQDPSVSIPSDQAKCLGDSFAANEQFRSAFAASITGDDSVDPFSEVEDLFAMFTECGIDLAALGG